VHNPAIAKAALESHAAKHGMAVGVTPVQFSAASIAARCNRPDPAHDRRAHARAPIRRAASLATFTPVSMVDARTKEEDLLLRVVTWMCSSVRIRAWLMTPRRSSAHRPGCAINP
jgi:hypothetical protein